MLSFEELCRKNISWEYSDFLQVHYRDFENEDQSVLMSVSEALEKFSCFEVRWFTGFEVWLFEFCKPFEGDF